MTIGFQYDSRAKVRGFSLPGVDRLMTWSELRAAWPGFVATQKIGDEKK